MTQLSTRDYVLAVERAYVAAATGTSTEPTSESPISDPMVFAAAAAVASRFLAIGTPRSLGIVGGTAVAAAALIDAHAVWFEPVTERRCDTEEVARALGLRLTTTAEALACDLVCVLAMPDNQAIDETSIRSGTHLNLAPGVAVTPGLQNRAMWIVERGAAGLPDLARVAAGYDDGRQLDEITVFSAGELAIARSVTRPQ